MALSKDEIIFQDTLKILTEDSQCPFDVEYAKITSWYIHYRTRSIETQLALYQTKDMRETNESRCYYYNIGFNITDKLLERIKQSDDRDILYRCVEFNLNFGVFNQELLKISDSELRRAYVEEKNEAIKKIDADLGTDLSTLYFLAP
jgi:hypothetical protein